MNGTGTLELSPKPEIIVFSIINMIFSAAGTIGNTVVCIVIFANVDLHTVTNYFIFSLSIADLLVCTVAQPMYVASLLGFVDGRFVSIRRMFAFVSVLASVSNLWAVTVDRFLAISSPLKYPRRLSVARTKLVLFFIWTTAWTFGGAAAFLRIMRQVVQYYTIIMIACIIPIYVRIFYIARRHAKLITQQVSYFNRPQYAAVKIRKERENIAAKTVGTVLIVFAFCWMPLEILPFFYRINPKNVQKIFVYVNTLALCQSALNPLIYSWKMESFRRKVRRVLRLSLTGDNQHSSQTRNNSLRTTANEETTNV
ncbi:predicted protein [Nematostella vectensis]|uniref:G-protein coupled receptors family 1 profile domain-containing protein n=1 Tax=Nematostella vectensis TaxID=45351 RepID=A7SLK3_NEMVE|nr:octopamine receptor [Nematostella vectensis]EDO35409.1 predicted protein [Nematostella vectensis]|eukprot:XP_001627509.1 predicted protein [Nematostella vectensis]